MPCSQRDGGGWPYRLVPSEVLYLSGDHQVASPSPQATGGGRAGPGAGWFVLPALLAGLLAAPGFSALVKTCKRGLFLLINSPGAFAAPAWEGG